MKRVQADGRVGAAPGDGPCDPFGHVAGDQLDLRAALFAQQIQELLDGLAVAAGGRPDQPAAVVVDDDGQVALALAHRDLIEPQAPKIGEQVALGACLV